LTLALSMAAPSYAAGKGEPRPPEPKTLDDDTVVAWAARYLDDEGFRYAGWDEEGVIMIDLRSVRTMKDGSVRYWARKEGYKARKMDDLALVRSYRSLQEVDCDKDRFRMLANDCYPENNLGGETLGSEEIDSAWRFVRPDTMAALVTELVCGYVAETAKLDGAGKQTDDWRSTAGKSGGSN